MACACKVNQEIEKIHKYYSYNGKTNESKPKMAINKKEAATTLLAYFLLLPLLPVMILYVFLFSIFSRDKRISMRKFFNFIHTVRNGKEQQII